MEVVTPNANVRSCSALPFLSPLPIDTAVMGNKRKQSGVVVPRLLNAAGLAASARKVHA